MDIFAMGVTLLVVFFVVFVIAALVSKSRNSGDYHYHPTQDDSTHQAIYLATTEHQAGNSQDSGDWGGRDMSHDHHGSEHVSDFGTDAGSSGDAGGSHGSGGE